MYTEITLIKGDKNFNLEFAIRQKDETPDTLVGCTSGTLKIQAYGSSTLSDTIGTTVISPGSLDTIPGTISFTILSTHNFINNVGEYKAEIELYYEATGQVLTCPDIYIEVEADLPD